MVSAVRTGQRGEWLSRTQASCRSPMYFTDPDQERLGDLFDLSPTVEVMPANRRLGSPSPQAEVVQSVPASDKML